MFYLRWGIFCDFLQKFVLNARTQFLTKRFIFVFLAIFSTKSRWTLALSTYANIIAGTNLFCSGISTSCLMSGSCHFNRASNDEFSVKFWIFVIVMFFNRGQVLKFGAPLRYYKGALTQKRSFLVVCMYYFQIWFSCLLKK